jgi:hypothetical protein
MKAVLVLLGLALLAAGAFLLVATGLQFAPTPGTVKIADHSVTYAWSSSGYELETWTPSIDARFAGLSVKIRDATGGGGSSRQVNVVVSCGDVDLWGGSVGASGVDGTGKWISATSSALIAKQGLNVTAGASCTFEVFFDPALVEVATGSSPAFVVWGFPADSAGPSPGGTGGGDGITVDDGDGTPPPPDDDDTDAVGWALALGVGILLGVLGAAAIAGAWMT